MQGSSFMRSQDELECELDALTDGWRLFIGVKRWWRQGSSESFEDLGITIG